MAFHEELSDTQKILLAVICFPLLPFFLCYGGLLKKNEREGKPDTLDQAEEGKLQEKDSQLKLVDDPVTVEILPKHITPLMECKAHFRKGIKVFPSVTEEEKQGFQENEEDEPCIGGKSSFVYPWDKSSLKSMPIDLQKFKELDAYAVKVNPRYSVECLVSVLLQEAHSDLEKVRSIWMWICHHIEYDVKAYHNEAERFCEPADVLRSGKSVCAGYARLFQKMCSIAGIKCKELSGYSKGYNYKIGESLKDTQHSWNAVYLDGRWHLLECTWGSGSVDDSCSKFTFRYDEFYFLTHPALFINDHFPDNKKWQLLKPMLTQQQFECNLQYRPYFYTVGMVAASPETAVIETENGKATILIESHSPALFLCNLNGIKANCLIMLQRNGMKLEVYPQQTGTHSLQILAKPFKNKDASYSQVLEYALKCSYVDKSMSFSQTLVYPVGPSWHSEENGILNPLPTSPIIHTDDGRCIVTFTRSLDLDFFATLDSQTSPVPEDTRRRHIWTSCRGDLVELRIHLPHAGNFALNIWAKNKSDPGDHVCALSYLISCQNTSVNWPCFPESYTYWENEFWILNASPSSPVIYTDDGCCMVTFSRNKDLVFFATLDSEISPVPEDTRRRHIWISCRGDQVELRIRLPHAGDFALHIWAKKRSDPGDYFCALSYLISCQNTCVKWPCFPKSYTNWKDESWILNASPSSPIIHTDDGCCMVTFSRNKDLDFFATLLSNTSSLPEDMRRRYIWISCQGDLVELRIRLPHAGDFALHIWAKKKADPGDYVCALSYLISCQNTSVNWPCFPESYTYWENEFWILNASPSSPIIFTDDGCFMVTFSRNKDLKFFATLDSETSPVPEDTRRRHIWTSCRGDQVELRIRLPHAGDFALHIWAKNRSDPGNYFCALSYLISCQNTCVNWPCFPESYIYWEDESWILNASPYSPVIYTDDGCCTVTFCRNKDLDIFATLDSETSPVPEKMRRRHIWTSCRGDLVELRIRLPHAGEFALNIWAKKQSDPDDYVCAFSYLISCQNTSVKWPCFPESYTNWENENWILNASPSSPIIYTDDGCCIVTFSRNKDLDFFATLDSETSPVPEDTRRRHIWTSCRGDLVELKIHLPHAGEFALHIWAKKQSDPGDYVCAFSYLISCQNTNVKWPRFPESYTNWEDGFELITPLAGVLPANHKVKFKLRLPGVAKASVQCGKTYPLTLSKSGFWEGTCHTSGYPKVTIQICKNADNTFWYLLEYKVETYSTS